MPKMQFNRFVPVLVAVLVLGGIGATAWAHCQVPCGIYADQHRFEQMLEDHDTIAKAQASLAELAGKADAQSLNQAVRWVTTKEDHATSIQRTIADYFMTQRIKPDADKYVEKLTAAHAVLVASMKAKQSADPATAAALKKSILDFYRASEGKEPAFLHDHTH
ncbi:MAG: superoxide dismutase [Ni] [Planctomycetaceae bacterium]